VSIHNAITQEEIFALKNKTYTKADFIKKFKRHPVTVSKWFNQYRNKRKKNQLISIVLIRIFLKNGFYTLEISGTTSAVLLCDLLYKDSNDSIRLSRKYLKYKSYINQADDSQVL
jgi:hypothetical protein